MALSKLWVIAYRDLGRNRRRTLFSLLAVALGLALVIGINGLIAGVYDDSLQSTIRLQTGHLQVRSENYDPDRVSLKWEDLLADPAPLAEQIRGVEGVVAATPILVASAFLNTPDESVGLELRGVDPLSPFYDPFRQSLVAGSFLEPDDRSGILIGKRLADSLGLGVDDRVTLTVIDANGEPDEAVFTIRGLFNTGFFIYDDGMALMPLEKAQAFTRTEGRATSIIVLLEDQEDAPRLAAALQQPGLSVVTWEELNAVLVSTVETGMSFYIILDAIVMLVVAVIIANTLLMAVFERIREMGILAALGMKGRQIMQMYLLEAATLALLGIALGIVFGAGAVWYLSAVGIPIGDMGSAVQGMAIGTVMRGQFVPSQFVSFSFWTLVVTLLASLYPAWFAARLEPVEALRAV